MRKKSVFIIVLLTISSFVFLLSLFFLIIGDELDEMFNVIGIRIATLFVAFASFCSSASFSFLIYIHNKTVSKINDDNNRRAELFREVQFASGNYSIIDFTGEVIIYQESSRYIERFIDNNNFEYHMIEEGETSKKVIANPDDYVFLSVRIPYRVSEGKIVSKITYQRLKFEKKGIGYRFVKSDTVEFCDAFLLYNEYNKRNEAIINIVVNKKTDFFKIGEINEFSKIKINMTVTSILGVEVSGITELYFTNPLKLEKDGGNSYKINSSNFVISSIPKIKIQNVID